MASTTRRMSAEFLPVIPRRGISTSSMAASCSAAGVHAEPATSRRTPSWRRSSLLDEPFENLVDLEPVAAVVEPEAHVLEVDEHGQRSLAFPDAVRFHPVPPGWLRGFPGLPAIVRDAGEIDSTSDTGCRNSSETVGDSSKEQACSRRCDWTANAYSACADDREGTGQFGCVVAKYAAHQVSTNRDFHSREPDEYDPTVAESKSVHEFAKILVLCQ